MASLRYCAQEADRGLVRVVERAGLPPDPKAYTWLLTALRSCELWEDVSGGGAVRVSLYTCGMDE